ncbi:MAG: Zn-dependent exopeptidase M28 [Proteobacteria bacterium]|nr:MAG: Zn-dependent exopeptidase M28 [Pseudomonadota bacterium]
MKLFFGFLAVLFLQTAAAEQVDLTVLNIDGIGFEKLNEVKQSEAVAWWLEMGDKLIVDINQSDIDQLPKEVSVQSTLSNINIDDLAFHVLGHCDHSQMDAILHNHLNVVYAGDSVRIVNIADIIDKNQLLKHDSILPFEKNTVLTYQISNRPIDKTLQKNNNIQNVLNQVNQNRWYSQVEYLAGLNRMLETDLITAGNWLDSHFSTLGLNTSQISLHSHYRGFNILGFKQGTTRADDWYIVGAHLDSRNADKNDSLPSPGAEDNASGCSGVLEMAHVLSQYETEASIIFMCFIEEENGLRGSKDVVTHFINTGDISKVKTMLNMDMIGYRSPNSNRAIAGTNSQSYQSLAGSVASNGNLYTDIDWQVNLGMCCTDFVSFTSAGIPAVTSNEPDVWNYFAYHSTQDLAVNVDPSLAAGIIKANLVTLIDLVGVDFTSADLIFADTFEAF